MPGASRAYRVPGSACVSPRYRLYRAQLLCALLLLPAFSAQAAGGASVHDRQAITALVAEYAYRWDAKDSRGFSELFVLDGVIDVRVAGASVAGFRVVGRDNILAYARQSHGERLAGKNTRHHFTSLVFRELTAQSAVTEHVALVTHQRSGGKPEAVASGSYRITWSKTGGSWLMRERILYLDR